MIEYLTIPWPWYVSGPLIGLLVPLLVLIGSRSFGISQNLEHICALTQPRLIRVRFFKYDCRPSLWSLLFALGVFLGGVLAIYLFPNPDPIALSDKAMMMFTQMGLSLSSAYNPPEVFNLEVTNMLILLVSGIFIGFGTRYASGCTSGHVITGIATLQVQSLFAMIGILSGGLLAAYVLVPMLWGGI